MDALLLAAGLGTRLRPLTEAIPKALLPINGIPLLDLHLGRLFGAGIERVGVNAHHLAGRLEEHLHARADADRIFVSKEPVLLGTGGAIAAAAPSLRGDPIAVLNSDALFAPPLSEAAAFHREKRFAATLILVAGGPNPNVRIAGDRVALIDRNRKEADAFTFTGLHFVSRETAGRIPQGRFFDIRDLYERLIAEGRLGAFAWTRGAREPFLDVGSPGAYLDAHRVCASEVGTDLGAPWSPGPAGRPARGYGWIDASASIGDGAAVVESVVLPDAHVAPGARVERSILAPGSRVEGTMRGCVVMPDRTTPL